MEGAAKLNMASSLPFLLDADHHYLVVISEEGKTLRCFADLAWHLMSKQGVTELDLTDHNVTQKTKDSLSSSSLTRVKGLGFRVNSMIH